MLVHQRVLLLLAAKRLGAAELRVAAALLHVVRGIVRIWGLFREVAGVQAALAI